VEELISIVQSLDGNTPKEEVQEKISKVDIDGKGSVNFEEFLNVIGMTMKVNLEKSRVLKYLRVVKIFLYG